MFDVSLIDLSPIDSATLQQWQVAALNALQTLGMGGRVASASYTQGDGSKSVTYSQLDQAGLSLWLTRIQNELVNRGLANPCRRRRAIGVRYNGSGCGLGYGGRGYGLY